MTILYEKLQKSLEATDFSKKEVKLKRKKTDVEKSWMDAIKNDPPDFNFN